MRLLLLFMLLPCIGGSQMIGNDSLRKFSNLIMGGNNSVYPTRGTGFVVAFKGMKYLVSNYHVFTNVDPQTGHVVFGTHPNTSILLLYKKTKTEYGAIMYNILDTENKLLFDTIMIGKNILDVVSMPLHIPHGCHIPFLKTDIINTLISSTGTDVIVSGFPNGLYSNGNASVVCTKIIYQIAPIAYENSLLFADSESIDGMSGSPLYTKLEPNKIFLSGIVVGNTVALHLAAVTAKYIYQLIKKENKRAVKGALININEQQNLTR